jgi:hypothetical protein
LSLPIPPDQKYTSFRYATEEDVLFELGLTDKQVKELDFETRNRFQSWTLQGQNNVEAAVSDVSDEIQIARNTKEFTFARNAVVNWALYKKRQKDGSTAAKDFLADYHLQIQYLRNTLIRNRGVRVENVAILGKTFKNRNILLPSQLDTAFYNDNC